MLVAFLMLQIIIDYIGNRPEIKTRKGDGVDVLDAQHQQQKKIYLIFECNICV